MPFDFRSVHDFPVGDTSLQPEMDRDWDAHLVRFSEFSLGIQDNEDVGLWNHPDTDESFVMVQPLSVTAEEEEEKKDGNPDDTLDPLGWPRMDILSFGEAENEEEYHNEQDGSQIHAIHLLEAALQDPASDDVENDAENLLRHRSDEMLDTENPTLSKEERLNIYAAPKAHDDESSVESTSTEDDVAEEAEDVDYQQQDDDEDDETNDTTTDESDEEPVGAMDAPVAVEKASPVDEPPPIAIDSLPSPPPPKFHTGPIPLLKPPPPEKLRQWQESQRLAQEWKEQREQRRDDQNKDEPK